MADVSHDGGGAEDGRGLLLGVGCLAAVFLSGFGACLLAVWAVGVWR